MKTKFFGKIEQGNIKIYDKPNFALLLERFKNKDVLITIEKETNKRTARQNSALHLYCQLLADALNDAGWDQRKLLKEKVDIPWTMGSVKDQLWRPIQKSMFKKASTKDLTTDQVSKVYEPLNRHIGEKTGVFVPFPSIDEDPRWM